MNIFSFPVYANFKLKVLNQDYILASGIRDPDFRKNIVTLSKKNLVLSEKYFD